MLIASPRDIFNVITAIDKKGNTIYRLQFKHNSTIIKDKMSTSEYTMNHIAWQWIRDNPRMVEAILFEMHVLSSND